MGEMIERVATLEHEQWSHWTKYFLANLTPENIERWKRQADTPYTDLTEKEKNSDRKWARVTIEAMREPTTEMWRGYIRYMGFDPDEPADTSMKAIIGVGEKEKWHVMIDTALSDTEQST